MGINFDFFSLLVVDLMHEFELGVWKALFIHLIRILVAQGGTAIQDFNARYVFGEYQDLLYLTLCMADIDRLKRSVVQPFDALMLTHQL